MERNMDVGNAARRPDFWLSLIMVALLFGVWLTAWPYQMRGYDFIEGAFTEHVANSPGFLLSLLIPVGVLGTWVACLKGEAWPAFPVIAGVGAAGVIAIYLVESQNDFGMSVEPAGWAAAVTGALLIVAAFVKKPSTPR